MTDAKYTPGEWVAVNRGSKEEPMFSVMSVRIAGQKPSHEVAICATGDSSQDMETSNAHLIVAAPNLLKALENLIITRGKPGRDEYLSAEAFAEANIAHSAAVAAIHKAKGKETKP